MVYLASIVGPFSQSKVPPLLPILQEEFQLSLSQSGWLMSVFALTGFVLSIPAGIFLARTSVKAGGIIALGCLMLGSGVGALAESVSVFILSRILEGVGMGLVGVMAPTCIAMWFPPERRGIPMGIWATWVPVGTIATNLIAPRMALALGWRSVWWLGCGFALLIMIVFGFVIRQPPSIERETHLSFNYATLKRILGNKKSWMLGLVFGCYTLLMLSLGSYYPTFLFEERGYSLAAAAFITSISSGVLLFSAPAGGWLSDRIGSRRLIFTFPFLFLACLLIVSFQLHGWQIPMLFIVLGLVSGGVPTSIISAASEVSETPETAGFGLAILMVGQNLGMFIGPVLFGSLVESLGWVSAGWCLIPISILGFVVGRRTKVR